VSGEERVIADLLEAIPRPPTPAGPGDDAALIGGQVVTTDLLVEGTHFLRVHPPEALGWKALAVNLSDVAAMGAIPTGFTLGLGLPADLTAETRRAWVRAFARGLGDCARAHGVIVAGGDTVAAPGGIVIAITAFGDAPGSGRLLRRDGARPGDRVCVIGPIGRSALGLSRWLDAVARGDAAARDAMEDPCVAAHLRPEPPLWAGPFALEAGATAAMDLSDGLATDLPRLAGASGVYLHIALDRLPPDPLLAGVGGLEPAARAAGGEDYGLLVTVPPGQVPIFEARGFHAIGEARAPAVSSADPGAVSWSLDGAPIPAPTPSFSHFPGAGR
jgi:thiamine-monophosphate kinase